MGKKKKDSKLFKTLSIIGAAIVIATLIVIVLSSFVVLPERNIVDSNIVITPEVPEEVVAQEDSIDSVPVCLEYRDVNRSRGKTQFIMLSCEYENVDGVFYPKVHDRGYSTSYWGYLDSCSNYEPDGNVEIVEQFKEDCLSGQFMETKGLYTCQDIFIAEYWVETVKVCVDGVN